MNIEKLAKHLKEFTLDEIEMIAEVDCKTAIKSLLNEHKIEFKKGKYYFVAQENSLKFEIFATSKNKYQNISVENAAKYFLENYVKQHCKKKTYRTYNGSFKFDILPFFKSKNLNEIEIEDISKFYQNCVERDFKPLRIKNTLALLNQLIKYYQNLGVIERKYVFQVRRITNKNEFSLNRIVFKEKV